MNRAHWLAVPWDAGATVYVSTLAVQSRRAQALNAALDHAAWARYVTRPADVPLLGDVDANARRFGIAVFRAASRGV